MLYGSCLSSSPHLVILQDNIADAKGLSPCANWARGIENKFAALSMASPFVSSGIGALDSHGRLAEREREKIHYVHSASLAYEDGSVFMSGPFAEWL